MNITLMATGLTEVDITDRLLESSETTIGQESERSTFERTVDNVKVQLSDLDGNLASLFSTVPGATVFYLSVYEDVRRLYRGVVKNDSIGYKIRDEIVTLDTFSLSREFWDRAKTVRITRPDPVGTDPDNDYFTLSYVLSWVLSGSDRTTNPFSELFSGFDLGGYETRRIRSSTFSDDETVGNEARFARLMPDTTVDEFLKACAKYYNAEFFIDPETLKFTMRRRNSVLSDRAVTESLKLEDVVDEERSIDIGVYDKDTYDYVKLDLGNVIPSKPEFLSNRVEPLLGIPARNSYLYGMTVVFADGSESMGGPLLDVTFWPFTVDPPTDDPERIYIRQDGGFAAITLTVPEFTEHGGVVERRIYRTDPGIAGAGGTLRLLTIVSGNSVTTYEDTTFSIYQQNDPNRIYNIYPTEPVEFGMWIRYNETTGQWSTPIVSVDEGRSVPTGRIFEVTPKLRFRSLTPPREEMPPYWFYTRRFFGNESFTETIRVQWQDFFRTKRTLKCGLAGLNYRVGDTLQSLGQIIPSQFTSDSRVRILKARNSLIAEKTEAELVTI